MALLDYGVDEPNPTPRKNLSELKKINNPHNKPTGHYTGRCGKCGSTDLWDDNHAYGCNCCGAMYIFG